MIDFNSGRVPIHVKMTTGFLGVTGVSILKSRPISVACFLKNSTHGSESEKDKIFSFYSSRW